jgi:hypothetical protein
MKAGKSVFVNELCLELKYCERCGGLWLRPVGSGQMFCVRCAGQVAEPLTRRQEISYPRLPEGRRDFLDDIDDPNSDNDDNSFEACGENAGFGGDLAGGVA